MKRLLAVLLSAMMLICSVNMTVLAEAVEENIELAEDVLTVEANDETPAEDAEDIEIPAEDAEIIEEAEESLADEDLTTPEDEEASLSSENISLLESESETLVIHNKGEGVNLLQNKTTWNIQGWGSTPQAATDGNHNKAWDASNRNPGQAQQLWIEVNPQYEKDSLGNVLTDADGNPIPAPQYYYNKVKLDVRQWNSQGIRIYTSNTLNAKTPVKSGPQGAAPNLLEAVERFSFSFDEPYPAHGGNAVAEQYSTGYTLTPGYTFTGTTDRFMRFENIVAYPTGTVVNVDPVSFRIWELEAFFVGPQYISGINVDTDRPEIYSDETGDFIGYGDYEIVLPESGTKEVSTEAIVIDTDGDIFEDENCLDIRYSLVDENGEPVEIDGLSIDEETGIISVESEVEGLDAPDTDLTVKVKAVNIYSEKNKPYLDALNIEYQNYSIGDVIHTVDMLCPVKIIRKNPTYYEVHKIADSITWDMIKGDNVSPDKVIANLNLPQYRRPSRNEYELISTVGDFEASLENPIDFRAITYTFVESVDDINPITFPTEKEEGASGAYPQRFNGTALVERPDGDNITGTLRITLRMIKDGYDERVEKEFELTVLKNGYVENLCADATSWNVNAGWGNGTRITDGLLTSIWTPGAHTGGADGTAGIWLNGPKTFNRIQITMSSLDIMSSIKLVAYDEMTMDLDTSGYGDVDPGTGQKKLFELTADEVYDYVTTDSEGVDTITYDLKKNVTKEYIMITMGTKSAEGSAGIAEVQLFYATPTDIAYEVEEYRVPTEATPLTFDLPVITNAYHTETIKSVDAETGEETSNTFTREITTDFDFRWKYEGNAAGVDFDAEAGTITFTNQYGLNEEVYPETIELILECYDANGVKQLNKVYEFTTAQTTEDYYELRELADEFVVGKLQSDGSYYLIDEDLETTYEGASVSYTAYDEEGNELEGVIAADGTVTYPSYDEGSQTVTIVATLELGGETYDKTFEGVVLFKESTDEQKLIYDMDMLSLDLPKVVSSDIELPDTGFLGSTITWTSSDTSIISNDGEYTQGEGTGTKAIILTAKLNYNGYTKTKTFTAYVKLKSSGGGGGGGAGGGGAASGYAGSLGETTHGVYDYTAPIQNITGVQPITDPNLLNSMFIDLPLDHWAKKHIENLAKQGIVSGGGDNRVNPDGEVTREQFVKMILEAFDVTLKPASTKFEDVNIDEWYYSYVVTAEQLGLVNGMSETTFGVGLNITRQDMAVIIKNAVDMFGIELLESEIADFNDAASIAEYAVEAVNYLRNTGILNGDQNKNFNPTSTASRAESMKVIDVIMTTGV